MGSPNNEKNNKKQHIVLSKQAFLFLVPVLHYTYQNEMT